MSLQTNGNLIDECITLANSLPDAVVSVEPTLQEKTVTPSTSTQTVTPDDGYDGLSQVTVNAMPTATQAKPSITVSSSGLITAKATQSAGYVSAGTKSATKQLTKQAAQTITPGTSNQTIASGRYLTGTQTIKGDANLVAENIKSGVSIFGVAGSYEGSGGTGGGGIETNLDTCTVTVTCQNGNLSTASCYIIYEDGIFIPKFFGNQTNNTITFTCLKDSILDLWTLQSHNNITCSGGSFVEINTTGYFHCRFLPDNSNSASVTFIYNDGGALEPD